MPGRQEITGLILAGGAGRRMGGQDKGLLPLAGRPLVAWVADRLRPQVGQLWISANRHLDDYAPYADRILCDALPGFQGPLAGLAQALNQATTAWLLSATCDAPLIPRDLGQRLAEGHGRGSVDCSGTSNPSAIARPDAPKVLDHAEHAIASMGLADSRSSAIHIAVDQTGRHPLHALIPTALGPDLQEYLDQGGRRVQEWMSRHSLIEIQFADISEAFLNLNDPVLLAKIARRMERLGDQANPQRFQ